MKRLCPVCFAELPAQANYCPICGKCMRDTVEQISQYIGEAPVTTVGEIKDCAMRICMKNQKGEYMKLGKIIGCMLVFTPAALIEAISILPNAIGMMILIFLLFLGTFTIVRKGLYLIATSTNRTT